MFSPNLFAGIVQVVHLCTLYGIAMVSMLKCYDQIRTDVSYKPPVKESKSEEREMAVAFHHQSFATGDVMIWFLIAFR